MIRRLLVAPVLLVALSVVGCGSATFGGLGADDDDGGFLDDTGSGTGDAIFPTDDTSSADTAKVDSTVSLDTKAADDSAITADSKPADASDTTVTDTATPDTGVVDTGTPDTGVVDTGTPDTGLVDTGTPDSGATDTGTIADTGPGWTNVAGKTGCYTTEDSPKAAVQCGNTCCLWNVFGTWHSDCSDTCIAARGFDCDEKADCSGTDICCTSNVFGTVNGSGCRGTCGGDIQLCATSAECLGSKTCSAYTPPDAKWSFGSCK